MKHNHYLPRIGDRHGKLVVIGVRKVGNGHVCLCRCDCGEVRRLQACLLYWPKQRHFATCRQNGCRVTLKHGHKTGRVASREYKTWRAMISRCENPKNPAFHNYGGRGIFVCESWRLSFKEFLLDMGSRPVGLEIGRIENDDGYHKANCEWQTRKQQAANRRTHGKTPVKKEKYD